MIGLAVVGLCAAQDGSKGSIISGAISDSLRLLIDFRIFCLQGFDFFLRRAEGHVIIPHGLISPAEQAGENPRCYGPEPSHTGGADTGAVGTGGASAATGAGIPATVEVASVCRA